MVRKLLCSLTLVVSELPPFISGQWRKASLIFVVIRAPPLTYH